MFPIRDTIRSRSFPIATYGLIAINVLVFLFESSLSPDRFIAFLEFLGIVPSNFSPLQPLSVFTLFTSVFVHGSWFHLISNMWTLVIFGDNVEDRMGSVRYVGFYLLSGLAAGLTHVVATIYFSGAQSFDAQMPTVGASGAIAGVLGAYFLLYPRAKVTTLIPIVIIPWFVDIPAILFLGFWFLAQLAPGLLSLGAFGVFSGIAWWAHVGGFIFGLILVNFFARPKRVPREWYPDEYYPW
jgi:membrane associated rhomboid family serine protease